MLKQKIQELAKAYAPEMIQVRHHLHAHPELSYQEFETSQFIQEKLKQLSIPYEVMATTGVVALIKGKYPDSKCIALRADIDALPIKEENDVPYRSTKEGVMHACGHDVHTSCLLGAAKILNEIKEEISGTVKLIFQPGEEKNPGGASLMIKDGVLENPKPQAIFGLHVHPGLDLGKLSFRSGMIMASADEIYITVKGTGGHAAAPHLTSDTILAASQLVVNLQQIISRNNNPTNPSVLSITAFNGGHTTNVIPSEVKLMGTFRAMNEEWRFKAHQLMRDVAKGVALSSATEIDLHVDVGYPFVLNDPELTTKARHIASDYMGEDNVEETELRMGAEDFGYYSQIIPSCFYRLGVRNVAKGITAGVHTPVFNVDDDAIEIGMGMMAYFGVNA
jgi:amidohydrolase